MYTEPSSETQGQIVGTEICQMGERGDCLYCSSLNFPVAAWLKTENDMNIFIENPLCMAFGALRYPLCLAYVYKQFSMSAIDLQKLGKREIKT